MKYGLGCFCSLEGHFNSDCAQFWNAVADAKHPHHREALSGVKASRTRLMNEAKSRKKEVIQATFTTKKVKSLPMMMLMMRLPRAWRQSQPVRSKA